MTNGSNLHEALATCLERGLTFAAFRAPGEAVEIWAQRDPALEAVDGDLLWELNEVFLLLPFLVNQRQVPYIRSDVELRFAEVDPDIAPLRECAGSTVQAGPAQIATDRALHGQWVNAAKQAIQGGAMEKVVLSRALHVEAGRSDLAGLFIRNCEERPDAFAALVHTPLHGTWCGLSPELLVESLDDTVTVDALAGTLPISTAPLTMEAWGAKERHEQLLVVQHVASVFAALGLGRTVIHPTEVLAAGNIAHLRTRFTGELNDHALSELVLALHPTPAVCGSPVATAREFITAHEAHERRLYSGAWGPWNPDGHTRLYVNIRCLQSVGNGVDLFVGSGITADSDAGAEWAETEAKAQTLLAPLATLTKAG